MSRDRSKLSRRTDAPAGNDVTSLLLAGLSTVSMTVAVTLPLRDVTSGPTLCPFRLATGLPCPSCGMTRSWSALGHGDLTSSLAFHPLGWAFFAMALWFAASTVARLVAGHAVPSPSALIPRSVFMLVVVVTAILGWGRFLGALP